MKLLANRRTSQVRKRRIDKRLGEIRTAIRAANSASPTNICANHVGPNFQLHGGDGISRV